MPKQIGALPIQGELNNMSWYKSKDGIMVKMKSVVSREKLKSSRYAITQRNTAEFGLAGRAAKTLRRVVAPIILQGKDHRLISRLAAKMLQIAKKDLTSAHGERNAVMGPLEELKGFEFNGPIPIQHAFTPELQQQIDRPSGKMTISIPAFNPQTAINGPDGATHFKIVSAGAEINFTKDEYTAQTFESVMFTMNQPVGAFNIDHVLSANSTLPLVLILGIQFIQDINGSNAMMSEGAHNALGLIEINVP